MDERWNKISKKETGVSSSSSSKPRLLRSFSQKITSSSKSSLPRSHSLKNTASSSSSSSNHNHHHGSSSSSNNNGSSLSRSSSSKSASGSNLTRKYSNLAKEQKARFYIMRRCVAMLVCWHKHGD
ncbi:small polypeptide DEVIL 13-like isoform X1 [Syzygium oleosum]|uniref:small polypeptide DEVIL 13-like isoform X1 n=1 Tax=Syzygium oleosum TaxID=219896 RepID=UPI0011D224CF|nr:small polypeptide DEVIL 13-like isoform X1 [Syzygium oleosum]